MRPENLAILASFARLRTENLGGARSAIDFSVRSRAKFLIRLETFENPLTETRNRCILSIIKI